MVYGLTKGQASPTSLEGFHTPVQVRGVVLEPFNPISVAVALDAPFVARAYVRDKDKTVEIIKQAISFNGFALVDIFQPCVTYNDLNTYGWFKEHTYYLEDDYDPEDRAEAFKRAIQEDKYPLGVIYVNKKRKPFERRLDALKTDKRPLYKRTPDMVKLNRLILKK
jgi:2-oxoglutarate ferredoxin oxidoreductase subunit beta